MSIARPTHGGLIFLLLTCAAGGVAFMNVGLMTALCASALAGIWISAFIMAQCSFLFIRLERLSSADVPGNSTAILPLRVTNCSIFHRHVLVIKEAVGFSLKKYCLTTVPPLSPRSSCVINRKIHTDKRGHYVLDKVTVISGDPCGFFSRSKTFHLPGEITVTPRIVELEHLPVSTSYRHSDGGEGRLLGFAGIGGDFFGIRPYRSGDEMQHIYWRGSAARNKLMVKEFEASVTERIHIFLDCEHSGVGQDEVDNNFEHLVSAAASISDTLSRRYCRLAFTAAFEEHSNLYFSGDAAGLRNKIIEALTELRPCKGNIADLLCDSIEYIRPGDTVFLLTMTVSELLLQLVTQLKETGVQVNWIHAPAANFPPIEPDVLRELPPDSRKSPCDTEMFVIDFNSPLAELLYWNDDLEKI